MPKKEPQSGYRYPRRATPDPKVGLSVVITEEQYLWLDHEAYSTSRSLDRLVTKSELVRMALDMLIVTSAQSEELCRSVIKQRETKETFQP